MSIKQVVQSKLVYQFSLVILPIVIVGFFITSYFISNSAISSVNELVDKKVETSGSLLRKSVDSWVNQNTNLLIGLSQLPPLQQVLADNSNVELSQLNNYLSLISQNNGFRNLSLLDVNGVAIASAKSSRLGASYKQFDYVEQVLSSKSTVFAEPRLSRVDQEPLFTIATYVKVNNAQGVLFASIPVSRLYESLIDTSDVDSNSLSFVLTSQCQVLLHPNKQLVLNEQASVKYQPLCKSNNEQSLAINENGLEYIASVTQVDKAKWFLVSAIEKQQVTSVSEQLRAISFIIGVIVALVVSASLLVMFTKVGKQLNFFDKILSDISKGNVNFSPKKNAHISALATRSDEVGHIGKAMLKLTENQLSQVQSAENVAQGRLTTTPYLASDHDQLGKAFTSMVNKLKQVLTTIQTTSDKVSCASEQMQQQSHKLSDGANEQSYAIELVSSALHEMTMQVKITNQSMEDVCAMSALTEKEAHIGEQRMQALFDSIDKLHDTGGKIAEIMKAITGIASNINLIALNAAIEAARAGEHGRGFAVVANEIRILAEQTTQAADDSTRLIGETLTQMSQGQTLAEETKQSLTTIVEQVENSVEQTVKVTQAQAEQQQATEHLSDALLKIEHSASENAAIAKSLNEQNESLAAVSQQLIEEMQYFKA